MNHVTSPEAAFPRNHVVIVGSQPDYIPKLRGQLQRHIVTESHAVAAAENRKLAEERFDAEAIWAQIRAHIGLLH